MSRDEIKQTIDEFLMLVEKGCGSTEVNAARLDLLLDKLSLAQHFATFKFDNSEYPEAPEREREELRKLAVSRFPKYSYYNVAEDVSENIGNGGTIVGDAIDDIADITRELLETKWCWENNSIEDGLWHFKNNFEFHWARHLRQLQLYLLNFERGT